MANVLKIMDTERNVIATISLGAGTDSKKQLTSELLALAIAKADVQTIMYPKGTPKEYLNKDIKGTCAGFFPNAHLSESAMEEWVKVAFGGAEIDFNSSEYWYARGYVPEKDPEGKFRLAVETLFGKIAQLSEQGVTQGIIGKKATLSAYFQSNYKGKKEEGFAHNFPYDAEYKERFEATKKK